DTFMRSVQHAPIRHLTQQPSPEEKGHALSLSCKDARRSTTTLEPAPAAATDSYIRDIIRDTSGIAEFVRAKTLDGARDRGYWQISGHCQLNTAFHILFECAFAPAHDDLAGMAQHVLNMQNADGGWDDAPGDARSGRLASVI